MSRYARLEVNLIAFMGAIFVVLVASLAGWWALVPALVALALLSFYRDPPRRVPRLPNILLAPADGRIILAESTQPDDAGPAHLRIVIFLSVFNVHINRSPCAGRVTRVDYRPGAFHNALRPQATDTNESNTIHIEPAAPLPGPVQVRQIAGVLARRIVCAVRPDDRLAAGQRYGMIKLGSQTELRLPADPRWRLCVRVGQRVRAGETILAELSAGENPA